MVLGVGVGVSVAETVMLVLTVMFVEREMARSMTMMQKIRKENEVLCSPLFSKVSYQVRGLL